MILNFGFVHKIRINRRLLTRGQDAIMKELSTKAEKAIVKVAANFIQELGFELYKPKSGIVYPNTPVGVHQASAPGESPANMTGNLLSKVEAVPHNASGPIYSFVITSNAPYSKELEFGSYKVKPRPFMSKVLQGRTKQFMRAIFKNRVRMRKPKSTWGKV